MILSCCGINHKTSSLVEREPFQISREDLTQATSDFVRVSGAIEAAVVATCNRIEFYRVDKKKFDVPGSCVSKFYAERGIEQFDFEKLFFVRQGTSAARHLFKVAAGLDSVLIGEYQIQNQVKQAYSSACSVDGPGKLLHKLFHNAFSIAKKVRNETEISTGAQGLAGSALDILKAKFEADFAGKSIVIIGANSSTEMLAYRLHTENAKITLVNRTLYKVEKLAKSINADVRGLDELGAALKGCDYLFSATASSDYVVTNTHIRKRNNDRPLIAVDLAVPRDIDPEVSKSKVTVFDLDDIKIHLDQVQSERMAEIPYALELIEEQVAAFEQWRKSNATHNNAELRKALDQDRIDILNRFRDNFKQGEQKALEALSQSLYKQFMKRINTMK